MYLSWCCIIHHFLEAVAYDVGKTHQHVFTSYIWDNWWYARKNTNSDNLETISNLDKRAKDYIYNSIESALITNGTNS